MRPPPRSRFKLATQSVLIGFAAGAATMAILVVMGDRRSLPLEPTARATEAPPVSIEPTKKAAEPPPDLPPPTPAPSAAPILMADPTADLDDRDLELPVQGATKDALRSSFDEVRGGTRRHEAIDILAPMNTPVLAVEEGTIAKLFRSDAGGITIYQFDPSSTYVYYYAHLDHYAAGLAEKQRIRRGQVIGYVGVTGNAPKNTPHLHFAIFKLTAEKKWWQGTPIDPYHVLK
jgi:murein DD-endopeptidase MepM/ murein hydrolase activator NlpD